MSTITTLQIEDGGTNPRNMRVLQNTDQSLAPFQEIEQGGLPLGPTNALPVQNFGGAQGAPYKETPLGYFELAVGAVTPVALSSVAGGIPAGALYCRIFVESAGVRYRDDGNNPAPGVGGGAPLLAGTANFLYAGALGALVLIAITGVANVNVLFYK